MSGIVNSISSFASFVAPVLKAIELIPGLGQISGFIQSAASFMSNLDKAFTDFPMGLLTVAAKAAAEFLPTPLQEIAEFATDPGKGLMAIIPAGVKDLIPDALVPALPNVVNDLVSDWI